MSTATGDGWELRWGDCIEGMRDLADRSVDHVITDPPYSEHTHEKQWIGAALTEQGAKRVKTSHKGLGFGHITPLQAAACAQQFKRITRRWILVFTDLEGIALWRIVLGKVGLDYVRTCIWDKVDGAPQFTGDRPAAGAEAIVVAHQPGKKRWNGGGRRNVFHFAVNGQRGDKPHPTTKPMPLMRELVSLFSDPGDLVLDPFSGSGSTGAACRAEGRRFLGWELDLDFHSIAARKIAGEEAKPIDAQPSLFGGLA
jgi:site-specific DNA-methyltransferase (adenine-specific)